MKGYHLDPDGAVADEHYAVVYAPRRTRDRFPEVSVTIVDSEAAAMAQANSAGSKYYPARVVGPARSSEGVKVFYLLHWLNE